MFLEVLTQILTRSEIMKIEVLLIICDKMSVKNQKRLHLQLNIKYNVDIITTIWNSLRHTDNILGGYELFIDYGR